MRLTVILISILAVSANNLVSADFSTYAHCYEAIYLYYGYLADTAMNGPDEKLGQQCRGSDNNVCTFLQFLRNTMSAYRAARLGDLQELGDRIGDTIYGQDVLVNAMFESGYDDYDSVRMFGRKVPHTRVLEFATDILMDARDKCPAALAGGILAKAKEALLHTEFLRAEDTLSDKKASFQSIFSISGSDLKLDDVFSDQIPGSYKDIDWKGTASNVGKTPEEVKDLEDRFPDFANNLNRDLRVPKELRLHTYILQRIRV
ncbi:hypothetical protein PEBR_11700 [Penicillium brasilianum]|uniref:Uncharacterized protein n=1 Tax=Penicillium brasilianum TaxID=104259 RepID=A0A1S9RTZ3_PENBI|nr:hypothetical protein PEBR_11700 [Penicillium brasilianum]